MDRNQLGFSPLGFRQPSAPGRVWPRVPWPGQWQESSVQKRKGFCSFLLEVFGHLLPFRAAFSTFSSLESTNPQGTGISKGAAEGETSGLQRSPVRAEAAEGRQGDSKERKGEKEGKDKRKKGQSWVEGPAHVWGPQVEEQATAPWQPESQSLYGLGTQWGLPGGIPVRNAEELPSLLPGIWSLPLHRHKKMMGENKHKGALLRQLQCQRICHKKPGWLSINPPDSPQGPNNHPPPRIIPGQAEAGSAAQTTPWPPNRENKDKLNKTPTILQQSPRKRKNQPWDLPSSLILTSRTTQQH